MKKSHHDKSLESNKVFPYVAWGLIFLFIYFVYNIVLELKAVTDDLREQTRELQLKANTPVNEITDFES